MLVVLKYCGVAARTKSYVRASPIVFGPRTLRRTQGTRTDPCDRRRLEGETSGIPHLAKNERDVGHPALAAGIELPSSGLGGRGWNRTTNLSIKSRMLCQLSYASVRMEKAKRTGRPKQNIAYFAPRTVSRTRRKGRLESSARSERNRACCRRGLGRDDSPQ